LINNNWRGLIIDRNKLCIDKIKNSNLYWKYDIIAIQKLIDKENINKIIKDQGINGEIGFLSIDIDGNDYWIWEAIDVISPIITIVEYNSLFGSKRALTIPYCPNFDRSKAHYSLLYFGSSLKALNLLAQKKNYAFVGCNSLGSNAFFVRKDKIKNIKSLTVEDGYVESKFRESRDFNNKLNFIRGEKRLELIKDLPVFDLETNKLIKLNEII